MSGVGEDWRNGAAYDYFDELGPEKIAHEFLRRNDGYAADYAVIDDAPPDKVSSVLIRWGLRFRRRSGVARRSGDGGLASAGQPSFGDPGHAAG